MALKKLKTPRVLKEQVIVFEELVTMTSISHLLLPHVRKFFEKLAYSKFDRKEYMNDLLELAKEDVESFSSVLSTAVPPIDAYYNSDVPCPLVFRQHQLAQIAGITVDLNQLKQDDMFWWQSVTDISIIAATQEITNWVKNFNPHSAACGIGLSQVINASPKEQKEEISL